jgi:ABC-2 type transport system permease protein
MKNILTICGKELQTYFVSPVAYIVLLMFLLVSGYFFAYFYFIPASRFQYEGSATFQPACYYMAWLFVLMLPLITMRLLAEERRVGTIELLLTSPVTDTQVVLGKYLASLALLGILLASTFFFPLYVAIYGNPDPGPIISGYLGLLLLGAAILAVGLLLSSLTSNQLVAAITSIITVFLLWLIGFASNTPGTLGKVFGGLSLMEHFQDFTRGVLTTTDTVYYLSVIVVGLYLTVKSVESSRWR